MFFDFCDRMKTRNKQNGPVLLLPSNVPIVQVFEFESLKSDSSWTMKHVSTLQSNSGLLVLTKVMVFQAFLGTKGHFTERTVVGKRIWKMLAFNMDPYWWDAFVTEWMTNRAGDSGRIPLNELIEIFGSFNVNVPCNVTNLIFSSDQVFKEIISCGWWIFWFIYKNNSLIHWMIRVVRLFQLQD